MREGRVNVTRAGGRERVNGRTRVGKRADESGQTGGREWAKRVDESGQMRAGNGSGGTRAGEQEQANANEGG